MNSSDTIYEFFDNALSTEQEASLFRQMADDESLRAEFRTTLALQNSMSSFRNLAVPSLALSSEIMAKVGYSSPITPIATKAPIWKAAIPYSATVLTTAIIAFLLFMGLNSNNIKQTEPIKRSEISNNNFNGPSSIEAVNKIKKDNEFKATTPIQILVKYVYADAKTEANTPIHTEFESKDNAFINTNSIARLNNSQINTNQQISFDKPYFAPAQYKNFEELSNWSNELFSNFSVEYNNSLNWNFPKESIGPKEYSKLNNMQFSLFYDLTKDLKIGVSVRQETFFSRYEESDNRGRIYEVEMQPNITNYGLSARYDAIDLLGIHFLPQFTYSFSNYGQILRPGLVLQYNLIDKIAFCTSLEYSYFQYSRQNVQFDARKASLNFGINYHL